MNAHLQHATYRRPMIIAEKRGTYRFEKDGRTALYPLPDVVFPAECLHQRPRTPEELDFAAQWFVYEMDPVTERPLLGSDGNPVQNAMYRRLMEMTVEKRGPLVKGLTLFFGSSSIRSALKRMGISSPFVSDAVLAVMSIAFERVIAEPFADRGMQYLYEVIAPVYDFFHQFNTGLVPVLRGGDFVRIGPLPLGLIRTEKVTSSAPLYPNDAVGRDGVAADLVALLAARPVASTAAPLRVLAIGDGPAITAIKVVRLALERGLQDLEIAIVDFNRGQIENGQRAWEDLLAGDSELQNRVARGRIALRWKHGSAAERHFPEAHFDAAFSTYVVGGMAARTVVEGYGRETLRALKPGGSHIALDFFYRDDDPSYASEAVADPEQKKLRASATLLGPFSDPQLKQGYEGVWDHHVELNRALDEVSAAAGAQVSRTHRQTTFSHIPLVRLGARTLTFSFAGYNERKAVYTKPG